MRDGQCSAPAAIRLGRDPVRSAAIFNVRLVAALTTLDSPIYRVAPCIAPLWRQKPHSDVRNVSIVWKACVKSGASDIPGTSAASCNDLLMRAAVGSLRGGAQDGKNRLSPRRGQLLGCAQPAGVELRKSMTYDQGREAHGHKILTAHTDVQIRKLRICGKRRLGHPSQAPTRR